MSAAGVTETRAASVIQTIRDRTDLVGASTAARADQSAAAGDMTAARAALTLDPTDPARLGAFRQAQGRHAAATDARRSAASALRDACLAGSPQTIRDTLPRAAAAIPAGGQGAGVRGQAAGVEAKMLQGVRPPATPSLTVGLHARGGSGGRGQGAGVRQRG